MTFRSPVALARTRRPGRPEIVAALFVLASAARAGAADSSPPSRCALPLGARVVLQSDAVDPDVFLWDSRTRLVAYVAGGWGSTRDVMDHTLLASPGTSALVIACAPGAAHPKYTADAVDAIGVKVVRGTFRGHFGWIVATDARALPIQSDARASR